MYILRFAHSFKPTYNKLVKENREKEKRAKKALRILEQHPFYPSLKSHKVNTRSFGERWSSWITGDIRVIWDFDQDKKLIIILFAITSHSGKHKEYK